MRFSENFKLLGENHYKIIEEYTFLIVGLGGLGGFIANALTRLGASHLVLVDNDVFEEANLNRQLFSNEAAINKPKVDVVKNELLKINPKMRIDPFVNEIQDIAHDKVIREVDIVFDAVDNIKTRLWLEDFTTELNIPLVHGAIGGWYGEVAIVTPGSNMLHSLYGKKEKGIEKTLGSPTFIPPIIANLMVTECVKWMHNMEGTLINKLLFIDVKNHTYSIVFDLSKK